MIFFSSIGIQIALTARFQVKHFAEFIPKAFPDGSDLILDAEVLMVDNKTGKPLPFGTLGIHKGAGEIFFIHNDSSQGF